MFGIIIDLWENLDNNGINGIQNLQKIGINKDKYEIIRIYK